MIGYDATNAVAQGLAAREKIFSFSLTYFMFIYRYLPSLAFNFAPSGEKDLIAALSEKLKEYFENYVVNTETESGTDKSVLAKYYLASIYYFEPSYDFGENDVNDIYNLGQIYLLELFRENLNYFVKQSQKYTSFKGAPDFTIENQSDSWKYFTYAMLVNKFGGSLLNIIQQPVCLPSRTEKAFINYIIKYLNGTEKLPADFNAIFNGDTTHQNKQLFAEGLLSDLKSKTEKLQATYAPLFEADDLFKNYYLNIIDTFSTEFQSWWSEKTNTGGNFLINKLSVALNSVKPENFSKFTAEQKIKFLSDFYTSIKAIIPFAPNSVPSTETPLALTEEGVVTPEFYKSTNGGIVELKKLVTKMLSIVEAAVLNALSDVLWEDSPNIIKYYFDNSVGFIDTHQIVNFVSPKSFITYTFNYVDNTFIGPKDPQTGLVLNKNPKKYELTVFFEFSFQPNYQKIVNKFGVTIDKTRFDDLKSNYILNFSKTETYAFLEALVGKEPLKTVSVKEFTSLFDLYVSLNHQTTFMYLNSNFKYSQPNASCQKTKFTRRQWKNLNAPAQTGDGVVASNVLYRELILYNPLIQEEINYEKNPINKIGSLQTNNSIFLGSTEEYGIDSIPKFNPYNLFVANDEVAIKFVDTIKDTGIGNFIKEKYNFNPYSFLDIAAKLLTVESTDITKNFVDNNPSLFIAPHSGLSKNLLDNLITNIENIK